MRVLAVAQAFKETLTLTQVADALEGGIRDAGGIPDVILGSDGGDGLLGALGPSIGRRTEHDVTGPLGEPVRVEVGWLNAATPVIESRLVCGLWLVPPGRRDPGRTTSRGLGELIEEVAAAGAEEILVGLGGSATMDGGMGMAVALGWRFLDGTGEPLEDGGSQLEKLAAVTPGRRPRSRITGLVDVRNPLLGSGGAMAYAAQKGASADQARRLADGLARLVTLVPGGEVAAKVAGAGAAGGLGFGLIVLAGASLRGGAAWMLERARFREKLRGAGVVVCTEGAFDRTSLSGKLTGEVIRQAHEAGVRTGLVAPRAAGVPAGVVVESGGGRWTAADLRRNTTRLVERTLRTALDA